MKKTLKKILCISLFVVKCGLKDRANGFFMQAFFIYPKLTARVAREFKRKLFVLIFKGLKQGYKSLDLYILISISILNMLTLVLNQLFPKLRSEPIKIRLAKRQPIRAKPSSFGQQYQYWYQYWKNRFVSFGWRMTQHWIISPSSFSTSTPKPTGLSEAWSCIIPTSRILYPGSIVPLADL